MPAAITLKGIPDDLYERLKRSAKAHHRSLNSEVIACLERQFAPQVVSVEERLARARALRDGLDASKFDPWEIAEAIRAGRARVRRGFAGRAHTGFFEWMLRV